MPELKVSLDDAIAQLKARKKDLEDLESIPPGKSAREVLDNATLIRAKIADLSPKIATLEEKRATQEAAKVIVQKPTEKEISEFKEALRKLNIQIKKEQSINAILTAAQNAIDVANDLL